MKELIEGKSVAVVGNAESLFGGEQHGEKIDSHDTVCRFNIGADESKLNEKYQGLKTDIALFNVYNYLADRCRTDAYIVHVSNKDRHLAGRELGPPDFWMPIESNNEIAKLCDVERPSSGLMALHYISKCKPKNVAIFGFDFKATKTYYHDDRHGPGFIRRRPHDYDKEKRDVLDVFLKNENWAWVK